MLTKEKVKDYLHIPGNDEDELIESILATGRIYLENAVDNFDEKYIVNEKFEYLADHWILTQWCPTAYDQREGMTAGGEKLSFIANAMLIQLQYMTVEEV